MTDRATGGGGDGPVAAAVAGGAIDVAAAVVFRDGRVLITQRRPGDHLGGLWEFPGGKREAGETFEACLQRELREELGIEVEVGEWLDSVTHAYPEKTVHLRFYRCAWRRHEPRALGCHAFAWVTVSQLAQYAFPPADGTLLGKLRASAALGEGPHGH
jgi:mutator protein MutT